MTTSNAKIYPLEIKLHQASKLLEIKFSNQTECMLSCEFLRVHSPSAEVKGHGPGQEILQTHKEILRKLEELQVKDIEQDKKIRLIFDYLKQFEESKRQQQKQVNRKPIGYKIPKQE